MTTRSAARRPADAARLLARLVTAVALSGGAAVACDSGKADGGKADGGKADGAKADGGKADGAKSDGGKADGGKADGGKADGGKADGGKADGAKADGAKSDGEGGGADGGKSDGGVVAADGGAADGGAADGPPPPPEPPQPPKVVTLGKCPGGEWCGPRPEAHRVATTKKPTTLGCPPRLGGKADPKLRAMEVYEGLPVDQTAMFANVDEAATQAKRDTGDTKTCCYQWTIRCPGGRPWLDDGEAVTAAFRPVPSGRSGWSSGHAIAIPPMPDAARRHVADAWIEDAAMEHASVASFARVTLELLAVGAPAELVAATQRAGLDEVAHAQTCLRLAGAFGAPPVEPGPLRPLAPRESSLARLAADVFVEGCVGETTAALVAERAAAGCEVVEVREALGGIARDEADHAALAWRTLAWALERGGEGVRDAVASTVHAMQSELFGEAAAAPRPTSSSTAARSAVARLGGRLDAAAMAQAQHDAWRSIIVPMLAQHGIA